MIKIAKLSAFRTLCTAKRKYCICKNSEVKKISVLKHDIFNETVISSTHLTPELKLHLITADCKLWHSCSAEPFKKDPFWGFYWPGGQSLSRYILDNGSIVEGKRVLDFGCGCGACGLSAKKTKAKFVLFNDIDEAALAALEQNARLNQLPVDGMSSANLIASECSDIDVVLVGDMFYDSDFAEDVVNWLSKLSEKGKKILIGDPGRFALESHPFRNNLRCVAKYVLPSYSILENNGFTDAYVWELKKQ